jgi:hypothetical protein
MMMHGTSGPRMKFKENINPGNRALSAGGWERKSTTYKCRRSSGPGIEEGRAVHVISSPGGDGLDVSSEMDTACRS